MTFSRRKCCTLRNFAGFFTGIIIGLIFGWINLTLTTKTELPNIRNSEGNIGNSFFKKPCVHIHDETLLNLNINKRSEVDKISIKERINIDNANNNRKPSVSSTKYVNDRNVDNNFLYIGVLTAKKYLPTRGRAIQDTWARQVPGRVEFYIGGVGEKDDSFAIDLPIVRLPTVDDNAYPPQKKSFMLLKHMYDNYLAGYQWFMRADDDVYLKADKLENFLRKLNSSDALYIGQTGMGNEEERGKLSLNYGENYCMGGPGMIFSREVIRRVAPNIKYCLQHLYTWHEDVEISRCVRMFAGVNCVWSYEMKTLFYEHYAVREGYIDPLEHSQSSMEIERAITLHPNKKPDYQRKLHLHVLKKKVTAKLTDVRTLSRDIISVDSLLEKLSDLDEFMLGIQPSLKRFVPLKK